MKGKTMFIMSVIMLLLSFSSVMVMVSQNSYGENLSGEGTRSIIQSQPTVYINGDWNVTTDTIRSNETIILSGNLTVLNNATLTFRNVTLIMNCTSAGQYIIEVKSGASMYILDLDNSNITMEDASNITAMDSNYPYLFWVDDGSYFEMRNSELHRCGGFGIAGISPVTKTFGLHIQTDNATIDHNLISNNYYGIVLYGSDATVSNNTITWNDVGVYAGYWSNGTIENNWITWGNTYGIWITGGGNVNPKPSNVTVIGNVITDTGRGSNTADGLQVEYNSSPIIKNTIVLRSTEDAIYSNEASPTLINVTLDGGNLGVSTSTSGTVTLINSTIRNTAGGDVSAAGGEVILLNCSFNESKIHAENDGKIYVKWYLHVFVEDSEGTPIPAADVRIRDNENGTYDENFTTDGNGYVKWIVLTDYQMIAYRNKTYYTPYNINVTYGNLNFSDNPRDVEVNVSKTEIFTATTPVPEFDYILIPVMIAITISLAFLRRKRKTCNMQKD